MRKKWLLALSVPCWIMPGAAVSAVEMASDTLFMPARIVGHRSTELLHDARSRSLFETLKRDIAAFRQKQKW